MLDHDLVKLNLIEESFLVGIVNNRLFYETGSRKKVSDLKSIDKDWLINAINGVLITSLLSASGRAFLVELRMRLTGVAN